MLTVRAICVLFGVFALALVNLAVAQPAKAGAQPKQPRVDQHGDELPEAAMARLGTTRYRHGGLDLLGFTPDGKSLIYNGSGSLHLMESATGKQSKVIRYGEPEPRVYRRFGLDSQTAVSGDTKVMAFASSRVPGNPGTSVTVIDIETGKERKRFSSADLFKNGQQFFDPPGLSLSHDGKWLVAYPAFDNGPGGGRLPVAWADTTTGQRMHEIDPEKDWHFSRARFSRDNRQVIVLEFNDTNGTTRLRVFDAVRGTAVLSVEMQGNNRGLQFELRPDGQTLLATNGQGGPVRLYDFTAGRDLKEIRAFSDMQPGGCFAQSPDGKQVFITGRNKVSQWDVEAGKEIRQIEVTGMPKEDAIFGGGFGGPMGFSPRQLLAISPDGKQLAYSGSNCVNFYETATGKHVAGGGIGGAAISVVRFTPNGNGLIVGNSEHAVQLWDHNTAKKLKEFARFEKDPPRRPGEFALFSTFAGNAGFSEDGKLLAIGMGESGVGLWDTVTGAAIKRYGPESDKDKNMGRGELPFAFAFAPQGNTLAVSAPNGAIKLWDAAAGKQLRGWTWYSGAARPEQRMEAAMLSLAFSPDGKTLAGCGVSSVFDGIPQTAIILWETATGNERLRLKSDLKSIGGDDMGLEMIFMVLDQMGLSATFSPDGKHLMIGTFTGLHVVDAHTGKDVVSYSGRQMIGRTATFSRDGKLLFLGRVDGALRVLELPSGRVLRDFPAHSEPIIALNLSSDGKMLASGSSDSTVLLWEVAELSRPAIPAKMVYSTQELEGFWSDLAGADASKAFKAINAFASVPGQAAPYLKTHLTPVAPVDQNLVENMLDDLNSPKFPVRDKATADLEKLGDLARSALKTRLTTKPALEVQQRIEKLLAKLNGPLQSPQALQSIRAIEALERIGTSEALVVLSEIAKGAPGHRLTEDAREAVVRLERTLKRQ